MEINSTSTLRTFLVEQMTEVAEGNAELERAKGVANIAQQIYNSLLIELKIAKAKSELGDAEIESIDF